MDSLRIGLHPHSLGVLQAQCWPPFTPRPATLAGRILVEALALAHGIEARAQLGQAANPLLSFLGGGCHQVQVLAAALEGDGEAARRREGAPEAPQALGLVALADGLDVLHEDCGEGQPHAADQRRQAGQARSLARPAPHPPRLTDVLRQCARDFPLEPHAQAVLLQPVQSLLLPCPRADLAEPGAPQHGLNVLILSQACGVQMPGVWVGGSPSWNMLPSLGFDSKLDVPPRPRALSPCQAAATCALEQSNPSGTRGTQASPKVALSATPLHYSL